MKKHQMAIIASLLGSNQIRRAGGETMDLVRFNRELPAQTREIEMGHIDKEKRTVQFSFSSEAPVKRWFGNEILDHSEGAIDWSRLASGRAAFLVDHDWGDQVGVIERAWIDNARRGQVIVRFGRSDRATEIFNDVVDGIRTLTSVGYQVLEAKLSVERDDGDDDYLVTRWMPYEVSVVAVPADHTVGAGRAAPFSAIPHNDNPETSGNNGRTEQKPAGQKPKIGVRQMKEKIVFDHNGNKVRALVDENNAIVQILEVLEMRQQATNQPDGTQHNPQRNLPNPTGDPQELLKAERKRVADLTAMGELYGVQRAAAVAVSEGTTTEAFAAIALDEVNKRGQQHPNSKDGGHSQRKPIKEMDNPEIGLNEKEVRQFSLFNLVRHLEKPNDERLREAAAFEIECSEAAQKQTGRTARGALIPQDVLGQFGNEATMRAFNANQGAANTPVGAITGGNLVQTNFLASSFIDMLRNRTVIMQLARVMGGLVGNIEIPKQIGASQAYWIGEHEDAQETTPIIGQIGLNPHTLAAYTDITRRLMMQSTPDAEGLVRSDLIAAIAQGINEAAFYADGTGNAPTGLLYQDGIGAHELTAAGLTYQDAVAMESMIAADNADVGSMAYVFNSGVRGQTKTTPKFGTGTDQGVVWESGNTVNGYRTEVTNTIRNKDVFFGNFNDFIIGMWGGLDMIVDPYTLSKKGGLRIVVFQDVDFALRREESFVHAAVAAAGGA